MAEDGVAAVSVKIPPFWPLDPELWFLQVEAQFNVRNVTQSKTKYNHVVAAISPETATVVRDVVKNPSEDDPYKQLKDTLIRRVGMSQHQRLQKLLSDEEIGDRKPSQMLRDMEHLLGEVESKQILRELFLQRLPTNLRTVLATLDLELPELAEKADNIIDLLDPPAVMAEIDQLQQEVAFLKRNSSGFQAKRFVQRKKEHFEQCWYHRRFGLKANKCVLPCNFEGNASTSH